MGAPILSCTLNSVGGPERTTSGRSATSVHHIPNFCATEHVCAKHAVFVAVQPKKHSLRTRQDSGHSALLAKKTFSTRTATSQKNILFAHGTNASDPTDAAARTYNIVEQVFSRDLEGGERAVILFNRAETAQTISVTWLELQLPSHDKYRVRDIWARGTSGADVGDFPNGYSGLVEPHAAMTLRISPAPQSAMSDSE